MSARMFPSLYTTAVISVVSGCGINSNKPADAMPYGTDKIATSERTHDDTFLLTLFLPQFLNSLPQPFDHLRVVCRYNLALFPDMSKRRDSILPLTT